MVVTNYFATMAKTGHNAEVSTIDAIFCKFTTIYLNNTTLIIKN